MNATATTSAQANSKTLADFGFDFDAYYNSLPAKGEKPRHPKTYRRNRLNQLATHDEIADYTFMQSCAADHQIAHLPGVVC